MSLQLTRPLAIFDLETTGLNVGTDRIIEIAIIKLSPDGSRQVKRKFINPERGIPKEVTELTGITEEMVKDAPTFRQVAHELKQFIEQADLAGFNSNRFDIPVLAEEFLRAGVEIDLAGRRLLDVQKIFHQLEPRNLSAAYKFYCEKDLENAHSAEADTAATLEILEAQVKRYPQLGNSLDSIFGVIGEEEVVDFARRLVKENGKIVFNFGKHKGREVAKVFENEPSYYDWMMQGDFPEHTKFKITQIFREGKLGRFMK